MTLSNVGGTPSRPVCRRDLAFGEENPIQIRFTANDSRSLTVPRSSSLRREVQLTGRRFSDPCPAGGLRD